MTKLKGKSLREDSWKKVAEYNFVSGSRDITATYLLGQEAGDGGVMGDLTAYLQRMREGDGLRGRGEAADAVVDTGVRGETYEGHVRRYFCSVKGAVATGIWQAW